jgi:hypothetical protein
MNLDSSKSRTCAFYLCFISNFASSLKIYFSMKTSTFLLIVVLLAGPLVMLAQQQSSFDKLDTRVDNNGYWKEAAKHGLTKLNPQVTVPKAVYKGSEIRAITTITENSPDVLIINGAPQSENSVFINPNDPENALNSNNSGGPSPFYGANDVYTDDAGETWDGELAGAGGSNSGDPTTAIDLNGRSYVGFISSSYGIGTSYSDDFGQTWTMVQVAPNPGGSGLDKNHLWVDNSSTSPYAGQLYHAWSAFGGPNNNDIEVSRSTNGGETWSSPLNVSQTINAGSHSQGVNVQTGPNGEVYAFFTIYDNWPSDEDALGMARSFDGGQTYESFRILDNIRGIRNTGTGKNMRAQSYPSGAVDLSTGTHRGNVYIVWPNIGYPGINTGNDIDVYMIRSEDNGTTWSDPIRVNQDTPGLGKKHYQCWMTCDPASGTLSVIFYDDRDVSSSQCEVYCANSYDGGDTWEDFKVGDVAFTPSPIPGMASDYMGDYLGISARNGHVYPVWTDNRTGTAEAYCSPYLTSTISAPTNLQASLDDPTGGVQLTWQHQGSPTFSYYKIYRNLMLVGTSTWPIFNDTLPAYGHYRYSVTAYYEAEGESGPAIVDVQWGNAQAQINPGTIEEYVLPEGTASKVVNLANVGQLPLEYTAEFSVPASFNPPSRAYCTGVGGCGESIRRVKYGNVDNFSECNGYEDFTALGSLVTKGTTFTVTVHNSTNIYPEDVCGIWIDWNQDENLTNDGTITVAGSPGIGPYTATITVPDDALDGTTRMRIRIKRGGTASPCGSLPYGEVEDYSISVLGWVSASPNAGTISAGESQDITFSLDAAGLALGDYHADYIISSNDPDNGQIVVPVTMHVTDIALNATADKYEICYGGNTTLHAQGTGGSGNYSYSWTSDPAGFTSTDPNPVVNPTVTTTYTVELTDGAITLQDEVTITVRELPVVDLGEDVAECEGGQAVFSAGTGFASYIWNTGATGSSITVTEPGTYWVEVANQYSCSSRDTASFSINPLPTVTLGADQNFCEGTSVMLDAGTGFSTYVWSTGDNSYYINATQPGEYWVLITDANGCSDADTIVLTMDPLPGSAAVNSGPLSVDNFLSPSSDFTCSTGANVTSYEWKLDPAGAGVIDGNNTSAQVTWTSGYTGTANISVRTANGCGNNSYSPAYAVSVYSSQGMAEPKAVTGVKLFPNPNDGNFTLQLTSGKEQQVRFQMTTSGGARIMDNQETIPAGTYQKTFNMSTLPAGTYYLQILDKGGRLLGREQVVVK